MDYTERNQKISLSQVNLKEFFKFYKENMCKYIFNYLLEDNTEIVVFFEENHFSHLIGLHKFKRLKSYSSAKKINEDILKEKITFKNVYSANKEFLNKNIELKDRLTYFPVLKTLLTNTTSVLKYDLNIIWNSKIEFSFLLRSDKIAVLVYLAVKEIKNEKKICVPVSLLVDRNDRFLKQGLKELKIKSIQITDRI